MTHKEGSLFLESWEDESLIGEIELVGEREVRREYEI